ncbi:SurA N-terminal domain-containing protein [Nonomuraea endophytica]|uniref:Peptidyl-prolyl cis-trans isomerase SurA n=1 Tax=Nonomuraea endophytica TaxID=714136 RepID=A0A7W8A6Z6_9ACTN|nr:SurA N-terminal domain-containing protein [Nonomuraea endophytica]MBB5080776.1 peptidyl-prolyl cis-trans isomerase SurA [Nonomuraea endophytica]
MKSIRVAVAAAAVGVALTACSSPVEAGAAAVVGGERIAAKDLNSEVQQYEKALTAARLDASALQVPLNQFVLFRMTNEAVYRQLAQRYKVQVSESEIDTALKDPGQQQTPAMNLLSKGVPPGDARDYLRGELSIQKILQQFGGAQNQQAIEKLRTEFTTVKVTYSPRYGRLNTQPTQENPSMFVDTGRFGKLTPTQQPQQQQQPPQS